MKKYLLALACGFMTVANSVAQDQSQNQASSENFSGKPVTHTVALGETVFLIAKKYMILPKDIYEFNPDAVEGISANMVLIIPIERKKKLGAAERTNDYDNFALLKDEEEKKAKLKEAAAKNNDFAQAGQQQIQIADAGTTQSGPSANNIASELINPTQTETLQPSEIVHNVQYGETLSGLARKYNTTIAAITAANEKTLKRGLQYGQELVIVQGTDDNSTYFAGMNDENTDGLIIHDVVSGETLIGLARKYDTSVAAITDLNEKALRRGLQIGQRIKIMPGGLSDANKIVTEEITNVADNLSQETTTAEITETTTTGETTAAVEEEVVKHNVQPGETLIGLARKYNTTIDEITEDNRNKLKRGLQAGQVLVIHAKSQM